MSSQQSSPSPTEGSNLISLDPWLAPFAPQLRRRVSRYQELRSRIDEQGGLMSSFTRAYRHFGLNRGVKEGVPGVWYREWAPAAYGLSLIGDFNGWDRYAHPLTKENGGVWSLFLPDSEYGEKLTHGSLLKVHVRSAAGEIDRIPTYCRRVIQEEDSKQFIGQYWCPPTKFEWEHARPQIKGGVRIYEAHVGMAPEEGRVGSFREFADTILPRIVSLGYNTIQLMAVMEHPYYGSFGYHVSNFFAVSSRFGTPEELKELIDRAHSMGLLVIMDIVHSHAVKNILEGLNLFDGTDYQYFHAGGRGLHPAWDSLCFDYAKLEVVQFLLSNVRFWLEEYHFDGYRFDGVTSMLYHDHGLGKHFSSYDDYFNENVDEDAVSYLMVANELVHAVDDGALSIAEDVSGMPGLARPVAEGGLGFDYRLAMGLPDYWIKILEKRDEDWSVSEIYGTLLNRRAHEKHIAYVESHDQALVGDKTLAFRLMDAEMYWHMNAESKSVVIDRGIALHKVIRLLTFSLGGEGYLNFMGNEFGHPEWIDFPREGNAFSYQYARRQWSLVEDELLRFAGLNRFDQALQHLDENYSLLLDEKIDQLAYDEDRKLLVFARAGLVFLVNLHPSTSYAGHRIPIPVLQDYQIILNSDNKRFGGLGLADEIVYPGQAVPMYMRPGSIEVYIPSRTAQVLAPVSSLA